MHYLRSGTEIGAGRIGEHKMNRIQCASSDAPEDADVVKNTERIVFFSIHLPVHMTAHSVLVPWCLHR